MAKLGTSHPGLQRAVRVALIVAAGFIIARLIMVYIGRGFTDTEKEVRTSWVTEVGELVSTDEDESVNIYDAGISEDLTVYQIRPFEVADKDFTYYDTDVQERLYSVVENLKASGDYAEPTSSTTSSSSASSVSDDSSDEGTGATEASWTISSPLAILNPYGTGSNGLYLYFQTESDTTVSYKVEADGYADYEATAADGTSSEHEFQLIGLVAGTSNHVTLTASGSDGGEQTLEFDIQMPETDSGYPTQLSYTDGESEAELSDGLYALLRTNGYLGYVFFVDNEGVLRYEMVTEGFGADRILEYGDDIVVCASAYKIARIDPLGRVVAVYDLGGYVLHHDINEVDDSTIIATVEVDGDTLVEDKVVEIDLETGEVEMLVDFSELMSDYREEFTRKIEATDEFYWQAGEWDWIHINTVQYIESTDSLIVSSRETSTIICVGDVHTDPHISWLCGDPSFWEGTGYEDLCLTAIGDFKYQFGQHTVEYAGAGDEDGVYYLRMFDNNYWTSCSRDDYTADTSGGVATGQYDLFDGYSSWAYVYRIDENEGTFELVESFEVPYSSLVSSVSVSDVWESYHVDNQDEVYDMSGKNWIVSSGASMVFGEYDEDGVLIREFSFEATLQGYRTIKYSMAGFWFAESE